MAFIVTALYALALFSVGLFFVRRGKKEKQESEFVIRKDISPLFLCGTFVLFGFRRVHHPRLLWFHFIVWSRQFEIMYLPFWKSRRALDRQAERYHRRLNRV